MYIGEVLSERILLQTAHDRKLQVEPNFQLIINGRFVGKYVSPAGVRARMGCMTFGGGYEIHPLNSKPETIAFCDEMVPY